MICRPFLLLALLLWAGAAQATVDATLLRDVTCEEETRGKSAPAWRLGDVDKLDWGLCQVQYESAWRYGKFDPQMRRTGVPSRSPGDLFEAKHSREVALELVKLCIVFYPRGDARRMGMGRQAGHRV